MRVPQPGETLGRYRLDRVIGQGGMAVVFAATDLRLDRTVALKVITGALAASEEFRERFHAEAAALAKLDSPYVTPIHDHDEVDGVLFIVTQYVDGTDLASLVKERGPLPPREALLIAAQLARGLGDAHRRGIVHRDVKPGNVLLRAAGTADAHAYLCDFGVARTDGKQLTEPGAVTGTWAFLAPEVVQGHPATPASDLYALGCVLYASLTGQVPYPGTDTQAALAHVNEPVPQLAGDDPHTRALNDLLGRLLAKDPADRPADAAAARVELERLGAAAGDVAPVAAATTTPRTTIRPTPLPPPPPGAQPPPGAGPPPGEPAAPASRRRWPLVVGAAALAVVLVTVGVVWAVTRGGDPEPPVTEPAAAAVPGDITGDGLGDLQVLQTHDISNEVALWTVPSSGIAFGTPTRGGITSMGPTRADVDGDGRLDQVWVDSITISDGFVISVEPSDGADWEHTVFLDPASFGYAPALFTDVDGDGRDDLVVLGEPRERTRSGVHVALSQGDGFADLAPWYSYDRADLTFEKREKTGSTLLLPGDLDGDGDGDLLQVIPKNGPGTDRVRVLTADGDRFVPGEVLAVAGGPGISPFITSWFVGDVDGDGADELTIAESTCRKLLVYEVDPESITEPTTWGNFGDETAPDACPAKELWTVDGVMSDVDGDGDEDLVDVTETDDGLEFRVWEADETEFVGGELWGELPCAEDCDDEYWVVD